jgi:pimeloyl-ACP methyl ester carboxylesterase
MAGFAQPSDGGAVMIRASRCSLIALALVLAAPAFAGGFPPSNASGKFVPGHPDVLGEYIQIGGTQTAGTPKAFDTGSFLRLRWRHDGIFPREADAVVIAQPGFASIPGHWLEIGAQLVEQAPDNQCVRKLRKFTYTAPCRIEVWIVDRRGNNVEDTAGLWWSRLVGVPEFAFDYYIGKEQLDPVTGKVPFATPDDLVALPTGKFEPFTQDDLRFMSEWGFEAMAGDVEALVKLLGAQSDGKKNIFLAGHSQGGSFVSLYAGRRLADGRRGHENLAGLIFLDGGPAIGGAAAPTQAQVDAHLAAVDAQRSGATPVFGATIGTLALSPALGAYLGASGVYFDQRPEEESIFPVPFLGNVAPGSPQFEALSTLRMTNRARVGLSFDTDPIPCSTPNLQTAGIQFLGSGLGELEFPPFTGTATACQIVPAEFDPNTIYGWRDGGGGAPANAEVSKSDAFGNSTGYGPSYTNVWPIPVTLPTGREALVYAGEMNGTNWYQPQRYELDMGFLGAFRSVNVDQDGVKYDIDRNTIAAPCFVARRGSSTTNPFPLVTDFSNINSLGATQTAAAAALSPLDPAIDVSQYQHTDFVMADNSRAGERTPGEAGASAASGPLVGWLLARSQGTVRMPSPLALGVHPQH